MAMAQGSTAKEVDYLKCEAMQRAVDRIAERPLMLQGMELAELKEKNRIQNTGRYASRVEILRARLDYVDKLRKGIGYPELVGEMSKIMRIEADMKAAGCPN